MLAMVTRGSVQNASASFYSALRWIVVVCTLGLFCYAGAQAATRAQSWRIDETQTWIGFKIDAIGFPTTHGHFAHYRGQVLLDFDRPTKSFTTFTVESASVDAGSPAFNDFVKSTALLDAERFPTMSFTSTQVEKLDVLPRESCLKLAGKRSEANFSDRHHGINDDFLDVCCEGRAAP